MHLRHRGPVNAKSSLSCLLVLLLGCDPPSKGESPEDPDEGPAQTAASLPKTDFEAAAAMAEKGRACGIIGEGYWSWAFYPGQFCATLCLLEASCADLRRSVCDLREVPDIEACLDECDDDDVAQCGDGTTTPAEGLCDLRSDCATGEDERHCERFTCGDGGRVSSWRRCDGSDDCEDGSDEAGCALLCGKPRVQVQE